MITEDLDGRWILRKRSRSFRWKIIHGIHSMLGGVCLIIGSGMCFAEASRLFSMAPTISGIFFSLGSFFLLLADLQEWCFSQSSEHAYEIINHHRCSLKILSNSFATTCGSGFYLAGSILLIPIFVKYAVLGAWLIMLGSATIFLCASSKIWQANCRNKTDPYDRHFTLNDTSALFVDACAVFGGVFYFFGVTLILPSFHQDDLTINISATLCVLGGTSFFLASIILQYRYYCRKHS